MRIYYVVVLVSTSYWLSVYLFLSLFPHSILSSQSLKLSRCNYIFVIFHLSIISTGKSFGTPLSVLSGPHLCFHTNNCYFHLSTSSEKVSLLKSGTVVFFTGIATKTNNPRLRVHGKTYCCVNYIHTYVCIYIIHLPTVHIQTYIQVSSWNSFATLILLFTCKFYIYLYLTLRIFFLHLKQ